MFESLKVTAYLQAGVITDQALPLDGILYAVAVRERYGAKPISRAGESNIRLEGGVRLPFERRNSHSPGWFYACSWAQWPEATTQGIDYWNKRLDLSLVRLIDFGGKVKKIAISEGRYKSYHMPVFYRHALSVSWYCFGDRAEIERLLPFCTHLGKKTAQGWGAVLRWKVEPFAFDWSERGERGQLMRAIPAKTGAVMGIRPSYWNPRHQFPCLLPDS